MVPPAPFLQCEPCLTPDGSGVLSDPNRIDAEFRKAWLPYFCRSGQRETSLDEFGFEVDGWLPLLPEIHLPRLTGQMLADVVLHKGISAGSLDGWGWRELKALPVSLFDGLARILTKVEDLGVWPDVLLDAYITMIPKTDGNATPLGQRPLCVLPVVYRIWAATRMGQLDGWFRPWVPDSVFSAGGGRGSVEAWYTSALDIEEVLSGATDSHVHLFVADVVKSFDTVDRSILDRVLSSLGLPGWYRHAYFEYHAHVRLRFKLASGLGQSWTRDGGIPQGCPLSMMFIVALYLPWCRYLSAQVGVRPQLYADNLKCLSGNPDLLLHAARFTTGYVRLVGQEPAPSKCVLLSTSREVRKDMKDWVLSFEGDWWSVKFDVRDLGGHLDTTFRGWSSTLAARVRLVISRLVLIFVLPLDFHGRIRVVRSMFLPAALHGIEASLLASGSLRKLRSAVRRVVWSRRQPFANVGAVLSLLDGPTGCDPAFCVVRFRFRLPRRYLALWPAGVGRVYRPLEMVGDGCPGHGPIHLLLASAVEIGFRWDPHALAWVRPGLPFLSNLAGPIQHFRAAILDAWRNKVAADLCRRKGFRGGPLLDVREPHLTHGGSGVLPDPARIDEEFRKAWLPYFCRSGQREASLEEFDSEVEGWLPLLPEVSLPCLTGQMLADVVQSKGATAGSLDGWGWRELKVLPVSWYDGLARILTAVEDTGVWPDGLLDAYIAMIPKTDGDATPLGQRPLSVLPVVYRLWASTRMVQLGEWFRSWVPDSVFSAGGGRGSVEAWYTSLDIEEVLAGGVDSHVHLFVADVVKSFDTVDRTILDRVLSSL